MVSLTLQADSAARTGLHLITRRTNGLYRTARPNPSPFVRYPNSPLVRGGPMSGEKVKGKR